ncbi:MAG: hypothetical protein J0L78_07210 [Planctomycetes bacterium]|nr:hypothetical protein [Planctomycetota bacterium]
MDGRGSSSYIDDVILREREDGTSWTGSSTASLTNRLYYLQNWRHDVVALVTPACGIIERTRYTSYGMPSTMTGGDFDHNLVVDDDDFLLFQVPYTNVEAVDYRASTDRLSEYSEYDLDVDGEVGDGDFGVFVVAYDRFNCALPGELSHRDADPNADIDSRIGYAGYQWVSRTEAYCQRARMFSPQRRWLSRDQRGYHDGISLTTYCRESPVRYIDPFGRREADTIGTPEMHRPLPVVTHGCGGSLVEQALQDPRVREIQKTAEKICGQSLEPHRDLSDYTEITIICQQCDVPTTEYQMPPRISMCIKGQVKYNLDDYVDFVSHELTHAARLCQKGSLYSNLDNAICEEAEGYAAQPNNPIRYNPSDVGSGHTTCGNVCASAQSACGLLTYWFGDCYKSCLNRCQQIISKCKHGNCP